MPRYMIRLTSLDSVTSQANEMLEQSQDSRLTIESARDRIAESYGFASWRQLECYFGRQETGPEEFQHLSCLTYTTSDSPHRRERARSMLAEHPEIESKDIYFAATVGNLDEVQRFLDEDPTLVNQRGGYFDWEPLLYACYSRINLSDRSTLDVAKLLVERGANPDSHYMWGGQYRFTALTGALGEGEMGPSNQPEHERCTELVELLLEAGADSNDGQALYNRMFEPGQHWIETLIRYGLNKDHTVNWLDEDGDTLVPSEEKIMDYQLRWAVERLFVDRARLLLNAGANIATTNSSGDSLYLIARKAGNKDFAEELASLGSERQELPEVEEFIALCMNADIAGARQMIEKNSNLVAQAEQDFADTAGIAAGEGNLEGLKTLQELGFNLGKMQGQTPMHRAVLSGHIEVLTWLVEQGCDLGVRDDVHGSTPLQWSEALGRQQCREYLCQFDLDLFDSILARNIERIEILVAKDFSALEKTLKEVRASDYEFSDDWCTPLAFAVLRGKVSAVRCLLQVGADAQVRSPSGKTLKELANEHDLKEVSALL